MRRLSWSFTYVRLACGANPQWLVFAGGAGVGLPTDSGFGNSWTGGWVIIAGDLYDRAVPPVDAIKLFNKTLARLVLEEQIPVYAISGNHDGAERLHFGRDFFQPQGLHLSTRLEELLSLLSWRVARFFFFPLSILLMLGFIIRMMRIRKFRDWWCFSLHSWGYGESFWSRQITYFGDAFCGF